MDANHVKDHAVEPPKTPLPEPDNDNITVLSSKLPNEPILPWNRYDSPWLESEASEAAEAAAEAAAAAAPPVVTSPESASPEPETPEPNTQAEAALPGPIPPAETSPTPLSPPPGEGAQPAEATVAAIPEAVTAEAIVPPLPATNHYLIDLAFEGTTD